MSYDLRGTMRLKNDIDMAKLNNLLNEQELFGFHVSDNAIDIQRCSNVYQEEEILKFLKTLAPYIIEGSYSAKAKTLKTGSLSTIHMMKNGKLTDLNM